MSKSPLSYITKGLLLRGLTLLSLNGGHCFGLRHPNTLYNARLLLCAEFGFYASIRNPEIKLRRQMHTRHICISARRKQTSACMSQFAFSIFSFYFPNSSSVSAQLSVLWKECLPVILAFERRRQEDHRGTATQEILT